MTQTVTATVHYKVEFDGTIEAYVEVADAMAAEVRGRPRGGLDSPDAGDATGFFMEMWDKYHDCEGIWMHRSTSPPLLVTVTTEGDLFVWDPPHTKED